jgi:hypothetical protein
MNGNMMNQLLSRREIWLRRFSQRRIILDVVKHEIAIIDGGRGV